MARLRTWRMRAGLRLRQRLLAANADAMAKLTHYFACGAAVTAGWRSADLRPPLKSYFGPVRSVVEELQRKAPAESNGPGAHVTGGQQSQQQQQCTCFAAQVCSLPVVAFALQHVWAAWERAVLAPAAKRGWLGRENAALSLAW